MDNTCSRCGSTKIIPNLPIIVSVYTGGGPGGGTARVEIHGAPQAWVFKDTAAGIPTVNLCGECGHAELHVTNFRWLYEKYEQSRQSQTQLGADKEAE